MYKEKKLFSLKDDQFYMAVYFWYLVKRDLSSLRYCYSTIGFYFICQM